MGRLRGRWRTYETGRIYRTLPDNADFEAYPYWEPATEEEFCDQEEVRAKAEEESISSTASDNDDVTLSAELPKEEADKTGVDAPEPLVEPSDGLHTEFSAGITEADLIRGMDTPLLKTYILGNGGRVDGRWGRKRLLQEAMKL